MKLHIQLGELLTILGQGASNKDHSFTLERLAPLESAGPHDVAIVLDRGDASVFGAVSTKLIEQSQAGLIIAQKPLVPGKNYLLVEDTLTAFTKLAHHFGVALDVGKHASAVVHETAQIDATAVIEPQVVIGKNVTVGAGSVIGAGSVLQANVKLGANVVLHPGVRILHGCRVGDGSMLHAGVVIGSDGFGYQVTQQGLRKIPQVGNVVIGKDVELGANCTVDRGAFADTIIEDHVKLDNSVHVAHNVRIGAGTAILAQTGIAGSVVIGRGCQIGGQVAIKDNVRIGNKVKIVSKTAVMNNLEDGQTVCGIPAQPFNKWKRTMVMWIRLPDMVKTIAEIKLMAAKFKQRKSFWHKVTALFGITKK